jgi:hypothetical protein
MVSAVLCRAYSDNCKKLGSDPNISFERATAWLAMASSWDTLADQTERLDAIVHAEENERAVG